MNEQPAYKVGDEVKTNVPHLTQFHGRAGTITQIDNSYLHSHQIRFHDDGTLVVFKPCELAATPAPPLGVECWRLLFRAHRDGWERLHYYRASDFKYRRWYHRETGKSFQLDTPASVR